VTKKSDPGEPLPAGTGPRRVEPRATYRIQLNPAFDFDDAAAIAPYLQALGVSHVYSSPYLRAMPGSLHGYDVVDPRQVNPDLGGEAGHARFCEALGRHGLGQVLDTVPNHMAIGPQNPWWWDVLENGPASRWAMTFDVDWAHPEPHLRERVLLPVLGDHYGRVLEAGELRLEWDGSQFTVRYHDQRFPVAPRSLDELLALAAERADSPELAFLADAFGALPPSTVVDPALRERRHRDKEVLTRRLAALATEPRVAEAIEAVVAATNADVDLFDRILERQNYRLSWWRSARRDLGYRRFFDVTTLVGLRIEDPGVFAETHALVLEWLAAGVLDGLRIDHPDGLLDPEGYMRRLRWASPRAWIVVEKILEPGEELRRSWPVSGTSGYEFLRSVNGLFVDPDGEAGLTDLRAQVTGEERAFADIAREAKQAVLDEVLGSELGRLTALLLDVLERLRRHRDHTRHDLHDALRALLVAFPVYRTYVRVDTSDDGRRVPVVAPEDETVVATAVEAAKGLRPDLPSDLFDILGDLLLLRRPGDEAEEELALRFQQLTGPVMAKGVEDTAFYRDLRLVSLNEVGGDPGSFGTSAGAFHQANQLAQERWPLAMLTTSTHDTKRSEDVRARISVLSEMPDEWTRVVGLWRRMGDPYRSDDGPDGHAEYLLYQTLVGVWPIGIERLGPYLIKGLREAKLRTSWTGVDEAYETAVIAFATGLLGDATFRASLEDFVTEILRPGRVNSLAQLLLKLTSPGVPDIYQGTDLWDLSLVDPDNRRPVDIDLHRRLLADLSGDRPPTPEELAARLTDPAEPGTPKLAVVRAALAVRARLPDAFGAAATYTPLSATGPDADRVVAFIRSGVVATMVPRLGSRRGRAREGARISLPPGRWRDELTGEVHVGGRAGHPVDRLLGRFPVALLVKEPAR
jgi:(1->4)-alpha-D-glucan 1-alpha-D-glucosylmutase